MFELPQEIRDQVFFHQREQEPPVVLSSHMLKQKTIIMLISILCLSGKSLVIVNITRTVCTKLMSPGYQGEWTGMPMCEQ